MSLKFMEEFTKWGGPPGRTPWSAADAHVGFFRMTAPPDQGSGADEGVRPTANFGDTAPIAGRLRSR